MSKPVVMSPAQWDSILQRIKQKERPSVYLSRDKMKSVLGFTVRNYHEYVNDPDHVKRPQDDEWFNMEPAGWFEGKIHKHTVRLDFYDEQKRTMFLLKYGNGQN